MKLDLNLEELEEAKTESLEVIVAEADAKEEQNRNAKILELTAIDGKRPETKRIVDILKISDEHKATAEDGAAEFNIFEDTSISTFGVDPQKAYMQQLKNLLGGEQIRDLGESGQRIINGLDDSVEMVNFEKIKEQLLGGRAKKWFNFAKGAYETFVASRKKILTKVESLEDDINATIEELATDVARMKKMYGKVEINFYQLGIYIYMGEIILERAKAKYDEMAAQDLDPVEQGKHDQLYENVMSFNQRLLRIKTAYVHAPVKLKEIRIQISATRTEMDNMIEAMTYDLAAFLECLNQIVGLKKTLDSQKTRNAMIERRKNMETLKDDMLDRAATAAKDGALTGIEEVDRITASIARVTDLTKKLSGLDQRNMELQRSAETALVTVSQEFDAAMKEHNKAKKLG